MMGFSGSGGSGAADFLVKLLDVLADPKAAKAMLAELREKEAAAETKIAAAERRERESIASEKAALANADARLKAAEDKEHHLAAAVATSARVRNDLDRRKLALDERQAALDRREQTIDKADGDVAERESAVGKRETELALREKEVVAAGTAAIATKRKYEDLMDAIQAVRSRA